MFFPSFFLFNPLNGKVTKLIRQSCVIDKKEKKVKKFFFFTHQVEETSKFKWKKEVKTNKKNKLAT